MFSVFLFFVPVAVLQHYPNALCHSHSWREKPMSCLLKSELCVWLTSWVLEKEYCARFWTQALRNDQLPLLVPWDNHFCIQATMLWGSPSHPMEEASLEKNQQPGPTCQTCEWAILETEAQPRWAQLRSSHHMEWQPTVPAESYPNFKFINKLNECCSFKPLRLRVVWYEVLDR